MKTTKLMMIATPMALAFTIAACNKPETPSKTQKDVSEAQAEGREDVNDAMRQQREDAARMASDSAMKGMSGTATMTMSQADRETAADNAYQVEKAKAEAAHQVAKQKCDAWVGDPKAACMQNAHNDYDAAEKAAEAHHMQMRNGTQHTMPSGQMP